MKSESYQLDLSKVKDDDSSEIKTIEVKREVREVSTFQWFLFWMSFSKLF